MQFFILTLLICLFIFLYCMYILSNDDFIFLRRDLTMEKLFNIIFIGSLFCLLFARLFYGFSAGGIFSNLFVFLLFPYFPGLSLLGGVVGAGVYLIFLAERQNELPLGRMYDFFSISILMALSIGFMGYLLFIENTMFIKTILGSIIYLALFIIFLKYFLPKMLTGKFKEGTISLLFLSCFSLISLILNAFAKINVLKYFSNFENIILILMLISSVGFITKREDLLIKLKELRKEKHES